MTLVRLALAGLKLAAFIGWSGLRDHRLRLDRLLVEIRARSAARVKSVGADGPENMRWLWHKSVRFIWHPFAPLNFHRARAGL